MHGVTVRLYERADRGGAIYREVRGRDPKTGAPVKDRSSLGTSDRAHAVKLAAALAREIANLRHAGRVGPLTMGQLSALYREQRLPLLSANRQWEVRSMLALLAKHFPDELQVEDITQHRCDGYANARRSGKIVSPRHRGPEPGARAGTIRNELQLLSTMLRWARQNRVNGRPLLAADPMESVTLPREVNPRRPVTTEARYAATLAKADQVDPQGRFRCLLILARQTGRRVNAPASLCASDVLRTVEQMEAALGAIGQPLGAAAHWPHGALRFRAESDKRGYDAVVRISPDARAALDAYLHAHPRVGDVPLFPAPGDAVAPVDKNRCGYWMRRAETLAWLPHLERGGWHTLRRLFGAERRALPIGDVMQAGGWRSPDVLRESYQAADAAAVLAAVTGPTLPAPKRARAQRSERTRGGR